MHFVGLFIESLLQCYNQMYVMYILCIFFYQNISYIVLCVVHHPEGELCILAGNCQHFTKLLQKMCYEVYIYIFFNNTFYVMYICYI